MDLKKEKRIGDSYSILPSLKEKIDKFCEKEKISRSFLIERLFEDFLKNQK